MKNWIHNHLILSGVIASIAAAIFIHIFFSSPAPTTWFVAKWEAGDILTYVSTIALSLLAVWQNQRFGEVNKELQERMLEIEESRYINDNACFVLIKDITVKGKRQTACNLDLHTEQVVFTFSGNGDFFNSSSLVFRIKLKCKNTIMPSYVRIKDFQLISVSKGTNTAFAIGKYFDDKFSLVAMTDEECEFNATVFFSVDDKNKIISNMQQMSNKIVVVMQFDLLTYKKIMTTIKCRASLMGKNYIEGLYSDYSLVPDTKPYCFWKDIERLEDFEIKTTKDQ